MGPELPPEARVVKRCMRSGLVTTCVHVALACGHGGQSTVGAGGPLPSEEDTIAFTRATSI